MADDPSWTALLRAATHDRRGICESCWWATHQRYSGSRRGGKPVGWTSCGVVSGRGAEWEAATVRLRTCAVRPPLTEWPDAPCPTWLSYEDKLAAEYDSFAEPWP